MDNQQRRDLDPFYWPGIDDQEEVTDAQKSERKQRQKEFDLMTARIFNTDDGKKWLDNLKRFTIDQPAWIPAMGQNGACHGYMREGQNAIVRDITNALTRAKENYK